MVPQTRSTATAFSALAGGLLCALLPGSATAQGFGVFEQSACAMARGGAGVALPCTDGSAIYYNPAGIGTRPVLTVSGGIVLVAPTGGFTDDRTGTRTDLEDVVVPIPHAYVTWGAGRWAAGLGLYVPYGLRTRWPTSFSGAFLGYDNRLSSIYVQPTAAFRVTRGLTIGAGLTLVRGTVELNQLLDLASQALPPTPGVPEGTTFGEVGIPFHTAFADGHLEGTSDIAVGGNFGLELTIADGVVFGARYLMPVTLHYDGTARFRPVQTGITLPANNPFSVPAGTSLDAVIAGAGVFEGGGPLTEQDVSTEVEMPGQLVLGVAIDATDHLHLMLDVQRTQWSSFDSLKVDFANPATPDIAQPEGYSNTNGARFGAEYALGDDLSLRAGYVINEGAAPAETVTPLLPEGDRNDFSLGVGWSTGPLTIDVSYMFVRQNDRRGRVRDALPGEDLDVALNSGLYSFRGHLFGATLTFHP